MTGHGYQDGPKWAGIGQDGQGVAGIGRGNGIGRVATVRQWRFDVSDLVMSASVSSYWGRSNGMGCRGCWGRG